MTGAMVQGRTGSIKVLHVCTTFLTAQAFIAPLAQYLSRYSYDVAVACSGEAPLETPGVSVDREIRGCPVYTIALPRRIQPLEDLRALWQLWGLIRRFEPHIVHTHMAKAGVLGRLAAWLAGTPVVIHTAHAFPFHPYLPDFIRRFYVLIERWAAKLSDLIIAPSESVRTEGLRYRIVDDPACYCRQISIRFRGVNGRHQRARFAHRVGGF